MAACQYNPETVKTLVGGEGERARERPRIMHRFPLLPGCLLLAFFCQCSAKENPSNQTSRLLANPYNAKVRGSLFHSNSDGFELKFNTRNWRVEKGEYALHLVARDKHTTVIFGSQHSILGSGSLPSAAQGLLKKLGMRSPQVVSRDKAELSGVSAFSVVAVGQFLVDPAQKFIVSRKVKVIVARQGRRIYWMSYITTEADFQRYLPDIELLEQAFVLLEEQKG